MLSGLLPANPLKGIEFMYSMKTTIFAPRNLTECVVPDSEHTHRAAEVGTDLVKLSPEQPQRQSARFSPTHSVSQYPLTGAGSEYREAITAVRGSGSGLGWFTGKKSQPVRSCCGLIKHGALFVELPVPLKPKGLEVEYVSTADGSVLQRVCAASVVAPTWIE